MGKTSSEVKNRWKAKTYKVYQVNLRKDEDKELIDWIEKNRGKYGISNIFREGIKKLMDAE